ncbi:MAG: FAD-binding oxidoreductase [Betaproteobacteria bacterium]|nr:FAD-binding oxidoreductase [Betaproteobacteria bacterium]
MITALANAIAEAAKTFAGRLLGPDDPDYEAMRRVHNGLIDKRPAVLARCRGVADVVAAVALARQLNLTVAVRGGGHNVAGRATVDDGLMIDLADMRGVYVDPKARSARVQGGATWGDFNRETQLHGLASTGGVVSTTGVGGLTLGGGLGYTMSKFGLALDNLLAVELVTADGKVLRAAHDEHTDLFWALRGGGGNFGVAVSFEFRLHPVGPMITGGVVAHPFGNARETLRFYRDLTQSLPDEMCVFGGFIHAPDGSGTKLVGMAVSHCGTLEAGAAATRILKDFGPPVVDQLGPMPYTAVNTMLDGAYPMGALNYWKSGFLTELSDAAIDAMVNAFAKCPAPMGQMLLEHFHGAATRVAPTATAFPHRTDGFNLLIASEWTDPTKNAACIAWARDTHALMAPFMAPGRYANYLADDDAGDPTGGAYGPNLQRLQAVKARYDPTNFFRINQNIKPLA